jgi:hypothetical protein
MVSLDSDVAESPVPATAQFSVNYTYGISFTGGRMAATT